MTIIIGIINYIMSIKSIADPDYGWHISVGRYIFENRIIPKNDIFSWYGISEDLEFISHECLSDLLMYLLGSIGNITLLSIMVTIFYIFLVKFLRIEKKFNLFNVIKFIWLILCFIPLASLGHRPYLFSYLFFLIFVYILFKYMDNTLKHKKILFIIPILQLLWVNMHGGSSTLIPLILIIVIILSIIFKNLRDNEKIKLLIFVLMLSIIISFINPYGYKILLYPFINMGDSIMLDTIVEWFSPNFHGLMGIYYFIIIIVPILIFICNDKNKINIIDLCIYLLFLFMMFRSIRFIHYYTFISTYCIGKYMISFNNVNMNFKVNIKVVKIFTYIILTFLSIIGLYYQITNLNGTNDFIYSYSDTAIEKLKELKPKRLFNDYNTGGYLTNKLYGSDINIFINGIADIYSSSILKDACDFVNVSVDPEEIISKYKFDVIIIMRDVPLEWYLEKSTSYYIYYQDETATIYKRV